MGNASAINAGPWSPECLTGRSNAHIVESAEPGYRLQPPAAAALAAMRAAAAADGIDLHPLSSFRDFAHQCRIWNEKYRGQRPLLDAQGRAVDALSLPEPERVAAILLWSALPGASRHHWGTDLDVIDRACLAPGARPQLTRAEYGPRGCFAGLDAWLERRAAEFGYFRPYDRDRGGVQPEPWHLSFAPLAAPALEALTVEVLAAALREAELDGRAEVLRQLPQLHARYVRAVAPPPQRALDFNPAARSS